MQKSNEGKILNIRSFLGFPSVTPKNAVYLFIYPKTQESAIGLSEYEKITYLRDKVFFLVTKSNEFFNSTYIKGRVTYDDIALCLAKSKSTISYHMAAKEREESTKKNGRPFILDDFQLKFIDSYIKDFKDPPSDEMIREFCFKNFNVYPNSRKLDTIAVKLRYTIVDVFPIEDNRYEV